MKQYAVTAMGELFVEFQQTPENTYTALLCGNPACVACVPAKYGMKSALVSSVGDDYLGQCWLSLLEQYNIDISHVYVKPGSRTNMDFLHRQKKGQPLLETAILSPCTPADGSLPSALLTDTRVLHIDGRCLSDKNTRDAAWNAISLARQSEALISFCVKYVPARWPDASAAKQYLLQGIKEAELAMLSQQELDFLGVTPMELLHNYSSHCILISMDQGFRYVCRDTEGYVQFSKSPISCIDSCCSDIFMGAFIYQFLRQETPLKDLTQADLERMIRFSIEKALLAAEKGSSILCIPEL